MKILIEDHLVMLFVRKYRTATISLFNPSRFLTISCSILAILVVAMGCGGSGSGGRGSATGLGGSEAANFGCDGGCAAQFLDAGEVVAIVTRGVATANQLGVSATISVVDRTGNVLAVYQMPGASPTTTIDGGVGAVGGLEGIPVPATLAAISKAGTGAYLSSQGNAFSTRTASQIVQENFFPGELQQPGGPLFGVQFSQLICGDVTVLDPTLSGGLPFGSKPAAGGNIGPRPLPLALSADPGGFPLYEQGDLVGGIGVEIDGHYSADRVITDYDSNNMEEIVALAASAGFEAPSERLANNMIVGGKALRYSDVGIESLPAVPEPLPEISPAGFTPVALFFSGTVKSGAPFGTPESGVANTERAGIPSMTLVSGVGERFPLRNGAPLPGGVQLNATEVNGILDSALLTAHRARAAIRRPLDSSARVSIFVVDTTGTPLGFTRSQDAPVFGIDVSLQKARTALLFSSPDAAEVLNTVRAGNGVGAFEAYVTAVDNFAGTAVLRGGFAMTSRGVGNLARPFYPDGINGNPNGPLSLPFPPATQNGRSWSPFNDGLQLDLVFQRLVQVLGVPVNPPVAIPDSCGDERFGNRLRNGIQIFAGSVPLFKHGTLVGAIGISGDGIDQDDLTAFFGASRKGLDAVGHTDLGDPVLGFNAPEQIRCDLIQPVAIDGTRLRYVNCPEAPFVGSNEQNVCDGL